MELIDLEFDCRWEQRAVRGDFARDRWSGPREEEIEEWDPETPFRRSRLLCRDDLERWARARSALRDLADPESEFAVDGEALVHGQALLSRLRRLRADAPEVKP